MDAFFAALSRELAPDVIDRDPETLDRHRRDWSDLPAAMPCAVALPRTTDEVSRILACANAHHVGVVPSGGRTGLAGGAVPLGGELVLSLARMRRMDEVDVLGATVRVQAGAVTEAVHQHCAAHGLSWPVDLASKGSSQIGGNISTNAGGVRVIRYGLTRQWVLGLEVVLADGRVLELGGALEKNNTGLDLRQLFIGTEGTLGVVTEATLKLTRPPAKVDVFLLGFADLARVLRVFREARRGPFAIHAFEFFTHATLARLLAHRRLRPPFGEPSPCYVLLEVEAADELEPWFAALVEGGLVTDGVKAQHGAEAAALWALREGLGEGMAATGLAHKNDVALPISELEAFCARLENTFEQRYPAWDICLFGHIGDGNLHINLMKPEDLTREDFDRKTVELDRALFELVREHRGTISAEHGIGLLKKPWLEFSRSPSEIAVLKAMKRALDPNGILNPGKIFDL